MARPGRSGRSQSRAEPRWSLLLLSLLQTARGAQGDDKGGSSSGSSGSSGNSGSGGEGSMVMPMGMMGMGMGSGSGGSEGGFMTMDHPQQAYYNLVKKDMMSAHANAVHTHPHANTHTDMMKMGNKEMRKPSKITTRKGRGKKGDKKMQMMYLGLMYIKSVIQMVMMAIGQVLQFKSVIISLVSVLIQVAQFVMQLRQKHAAKAHGYHSGKLAPVEAGVGVGVGWGGGSSYDHGGSSEIVEDGGLGTYAGYRYDQGNAPAANQGNANNNDVGHYTYGPAYKH